ncbi:transcriptional regulator, LysR family [Aliivibrio fischeri ES114]|uniref:Transcriptional regulator, LysR family n=1 Tax=Aliivibrio fischeri (strain ATCC 700601 / ES114) TaxID=312309 RepID=Q5E1I8_ALIF1|nr:LysR family transcriptional regulator [Aliivibrio fischeri]AAW87108.1 transcriptional regulator, LysR family [Aliivibrio fischeri ES114]KLU80754.1 LysR family transcriptional regulator [Aliivibrio fischeri]MUL03200.1 LysR family transcriptional regulator [Aliivibrio fischeri]
MNLNFIKHFLAVYDFGSVTKAADYLNITQPSMSSAIKKFEESYGQPLFLKVGRSLEPTDAAHSLAYQVRPIMEQLVMALESPRRLIVSAPEIVLQSLPDMDDALLTESPAVEYQMLDKIRSGEVDILIDDITVTDYTFVTESLGKMDIAFACRNDHPTILGYSLSLEQFNQAEHVMLKLKNENVGAFETRPDEIFERNIVREVSGPSNLLLSVRNTDAICIVAESMFGLAQELGLKVLESPFPLQPYEIKLIYHRRNITNKTHKYIREQIKSRLSELHQ